jgi:hypothetical protein
MSGRIETETALSRGEDSAEHRESFLEPGGSIDLHQEDETSERVLPAIRMEGEAQLSA